MHRVTIWGLLAALVLTLPPPLLAGVDKPSAVDVLFERQHLANLEKGAEVSYRFQRTVSDAKLLGEPFSDDIKIDVTQVSEAGKRAVEVRVFTGDRARDPQKITDVTGNPILVVFLDRAVNNFSLIAGGNRAYLKNGFRIGLREKAVIEQVKADYQGQSVDAYRITVTPFAGDKNAQKMSGYDGSRFTFVVSEAVPGWFVEMVSTYESTIKEAPRLEERFTLAGVGGGK